MGVKVKAGQVWEFESGASNYLKGDRLRVMNLDREGTFHDAKPINIERPSSIYSVSSKFLNECFNFIPQNDLEWLAVNIDKWCRSDGLFNVTRNHTVPVGYTFTMKVGYTERQWQNMRYYLGLEKKSHYEFINGQWTKDKLCQTSNS